MKTRVLVIDYMALARRAIADGLRAAGGATEVVATASSPHICRNKLPQARPDVILADLEPPVDEAARCLRDLMLEHRLPVLLLTALDGAERGRAMSILHLGPAHVIRKPAVRLHEGLSAMLGEIDCRLSKAHQDYLLSRRRTAAAAAPSLSAVAGPFPLPGKLTNPSERVVAIGASTGGTEALYDVLSRLPREVPGIVIVQHMPKAFTRGFAERLDATSALQVKEAEDGDPVRPGQVLLAPGGSHMRLVRAADHGFAVRVAAGDACNGHCPSVDVLMYSVATAAGPRAVGVLLTGMGSDGAAGLKAMRDAGAATFAQDEASSVVFGMPKEAFRCGGAERLVSLQNIPDHLLACLAAR